MKVIRHSTWVFTHSIISVIITEFFQELVFLDKGIKFSKSEMASIHWGSSVDYSLYELDQEKIDYYKRQILKGDYKKKNIKKGTIHIKSIRNLKKANL